MKKHIYKLVALSLLTVSVASCEMDQYPTDSIPNEESWESLSDAANFNVGVYAYLRSLAPLAWTEADIQADYFQPGLGYGNRNGQIYTWQFTSGEDAMASSWATPYAAISNCNNFLNNCDAIALESQADSLEMQKYKGEAYFVRAYAYFQLAIRFCKDYEPETANEDLGLPIVTTVDINAKPARSNMQTTWDFIKSDVAQAAAFITNDDPSGNDITKQAIKALRARIALWTHDYDGAIAYADSLIQDGNFALATDSATYSDVWLYDTGSEIIWQPVNNTDERNSWGDYLTYNALTGTYSPDWIPSQATYDMYGDGDYRKGIFFQEQTVTENNTTAEGIQLFAKYPGNPNLRKSSDSEYTHYNAPKMFRIAEQYLIAAEAAYRKGETQLAQDYLNALREARGESATSTTGDNLFNNIKMEWKKEFIGEGQRIFGLKRWHDGMTRDPETQNGGIIMTSAQDINIGLSVTSDNIRFVWEISTHDLTTNKNLQSNWGGKQ